MASAVSRNGASVVQLAPTMLTGETLAQLEPMPTQAEPAAEPETSEREPEPPERAGLEVRDHDVRALQYFKLT